MAKSNIIIFCMVLMALVALSHQACPPSSKVTSCAPKCIQDSECTSMGGQCCPNLCNQKSCVRPNSATDSNASKYSSGGSGSYCGNVKCNSYEKCELDKTSKRQKCVRS